jgi:hypothetical protein
LQRCSCVIENASEFSSVVATHHIVCFDANRHPADSAAAFLAALGESMALGGCTRQRSTTGCHRRLYLAKKLFCERTATTIDELLGKQRVRFFETGRAQQNSEAATAIDALETNYVSAGQSSVPSLEGQQDVPIDIFNSLEKATEFF